MLSDNLFKEKSFLEHKSIVQGISVLQILTGIGGFAALYDAFQNETIAYLALIIFVPIFVLDIVGGALLFRNKILGFRISLAMQVIHSVKFSMLGLSFGASIPIYLYLTLKFWGFGFDTGFGTTDITFFIGANEAFISLNIITVVLAIILFKIQKKQTTTTNFN